VIKFDFLRELFLSPFATDHSFWCLHQIGFEMGSVKALQVTVKTPPQWTALPSFRQAR